MEKYTEIKIFPAADYGYSVEDYHKDVGDEGITIESFDFIKGERESVNRLCLDKKAAIEIAKAILELCEK
jgi:hypothetical protein